MGLQEREREREIYIYIYITYTREVEQIKTTFMTVYVPMLSNRH